MDCDTVKKVRLRYYVRSTGVKCNSSVQALQWLDCFNDVSARILIEEEDREVTIGPLANIVVNKEIVTLTTRRGDMYEASKAASKIRKIATPEFVVYSDKKEDVEETRTKELKEAKRYIKAKRKVRAAYLDSNSVKSYSGFIESIDIDAKSFKTKADITYYFA